MKAEACPNHESLRVISTAAQTWSSMDFRRTKITSPAFVSCSDRPVLSMALPAGFWLDTRALQLRYLVPNVLVLVLKHGHFQTPETNEIMPY